MSMPHATHAGKRTGEIGRDTGTTAGVAIGMPHGAVIRGSSIKGGVARGGGHVYHGGSAIGAIARKIVAGAGPSCGRGPDSHSGVENLKMGSGNEAGGLIGGVVGATHHILADDDDSSSDGGRGQTDLDKRRDKRRRYGSCLV